MRRNLWGMMDVYPNYYVMEGTLEERLVDREFERAQDEHLDYHDHFYEVKIVMKGSWHGAVVADNEKLAMEAAERWIKDIAEYTCCGEFEIEVL